MKRLLLLFRVFFVIGAFTFGGGYAMVPLMRRELVERYSLIKDEEFLDIFALVQGAPGPIAVNVSLYTGFHIAGLKGAMVSVLGTVLPSFLIILALVALGARYLELPAVVAAFRAIRPAVVALIVASGISVARRVINDARGLILALAAFLAVAFGVHPALAVAGGALVGVVLERRGGSRGTA
ncbi:MAG: chromate transporter [Bacillota bacterium]